MRLEKIFSLISQCRFGIHDISRTELDQSSGLPRFNMPLELGIFLGAKKFGRGVQKGKIALILDRDRYRYQQFISDIAGQDISDHNSDPKEAIRVVRDWLRSASRFSTPSGSTIASRYTQFINDMPLLCEELQLDPDQLIFNDFTTLVVEWIRVNRW